MSTSDDLLIEHRGDVLMLTINRPEKRNALSLSLLDSIGAALNAARDESVKCVVLTGAGTKCFAAGGDLKELDAVRSDTQTRAMAERGHAALDAVRYFPVPVVGALNGPALGGGAELAMACDVRIGAAHAELGLIQSRLNVTTAWGGGIDLINAIGNSAALALLCQGRRLSATEAHAYRLYDRVAAGDADFAEFTASYVGDFTRTSLTVLRTYKATAATRRRQLQEELTATARSGFIKSWMHPDHWEAAAQALNKSR